MKSRFSIVLFLLATSALAQPKNCGLLLTTEKSIEGENPNFESVDLKLQNLEDDKLEIKIVGHMTMNIASEQEAYGLLMGVHDVERSRANVGGTPIGVAKIASLPKKASLVIDYDEDYRYLMVDKYKPLAKRFKTIPELKKFVRNYDVETPIGFVYGSDIGRKKMSFGLVYCEGKDAPQKASTIVKSEVDV